MRATNANYQMITFRALQFSSFSSIQFKIFVSSTAVYISPFVQTICGPGLTPVEARPAMGPSSLLHNGYRVSFPAVKGRSLGGNHPPPTTDKVKKRAHLHLYSPLVLQGLFWRQLHLKLVYYYYHHYHHHHRRHRRCHHSLQGLDLVPYAGPIKIREVS